MTKKKKYPTGYKTLRKLSKEPCCIFSYHQLTELLYDRRFNGFSNLLLNKTEHCFLVNVDLFYKWCRDRITLNDRKTIMTIKLDKQPWYRRLIDLFRKRVGQSKYRLIRRLPITML